MIDAGFIIKSIVEQTDEDTLQMTGEIDAKSMKAQKLPLSFVFKAREL